METTQCNTLTISLGHNITSSADELTRHPLAEVAQMIADPNSDIARQVANLRNVLALDAKRYRDMKKQLPYIVCAAFSPFFRKNDNFSFTDCFVVDVDHVTDKGFSITDLRARLQADPHVALCFISPSADGLKVIFRLATRCYDKGVYSVFYKLFVSSFSKQYGLEQVVDSRTSDVSRACFLSTDPNVYINEDAQPVSMDEYVNTSDAFAFTDLQRQVLAEERKAAAEAQPEMTPEPINVDPDAEALAAIKAKLAIKVKAKPAPPQPYVPKELDDLMPKLIAYVTESYGLDVYEVINIQYGKKMRARLGHAQAEMNLFFGKRGFRPVISPRGGTNAELNQSFFEMTECFLADAACSA